MRKYNFYFIENGENYMVPIEAENFEKAVNIAYESNLNIDVEKTIKSFFKRVWSPSGLFYNAAADGSKPVQMQRIEQKKNWRVETWKTYL